MGFFLLHTGFANNEFFPTDRALRRRQGEPGLLMTSGIRLTHFAGQDAIIGGAKPIVRGKAPIQSGGCEIDATLTNDDDGTSYRITAFAEDLNSRELLP